MILKVRRDTGKGVYEWSVFDGFSRIDYASEPSERDTVHMAVTEGYIVDADRDNATGYYVTLMDAADTHTRRLHVNAVCYLCSDTGQTIEKLDFRAGATRTA